MKQTISAAPLKLFVIAICLFFASGITGQTVITTHVNPDTVRPGELVEITYAIENGDGLFVPPDLMGIPVVSGPNISSSFTFQNGQKSSSQKHTYILRPMSEGILIVPGASYIENGKEEKIGQMTIIVTGSSRISVDHPNSSVFKQRERKKV